jgi:outer membrane protein assembly factor BamE (lipoprotein component of BamABCDE complex)
MIFNSKHNLLKFLILILIFLQACQLKEAKNKHGIVFLENRATKLTVNYSNTNDVINIIGQPHSKGINDDLNWIYIERVYSRGKFHKLGKNVLTTNNVLVLIFDKFGILKDKKFLNKEDLNELSFSNKITENDLARKSFVEKFLNSIKSKMYRNK